MEQEQAKFLHSMLDSLIKRYLESVSETGKWTSWYKLPNGDQLELSLSWGEFEVLNHATKTQ